MGSVLKGIKEYLIRNKVIKSPSEITEYETTCYSCKRKFAKEKLKYPIPISWRYGLLCPDCWKKDRNTRIGLFIFIVIVLILIFKIPNWSK